MSRPRIDAQRTTERPHVLIVTDDPSLSSFLAEGLPLGGFWTSVIASGLQALEVFRLRQFDIIVVDAGLQSFDAMELIRRLRGRSTRTSDGEARTAAPIAVFGEPPHNPTAAEATELGIEAYFAPPVELEDIVPTLHEMFTRWRDAHPDTPLADAAALRDF